MAQGCHFRSLGDIVEQSRIARKNLLDVDPHGGQGHRRHPESVGVTDRAVESRLCGKVWPAVGPVGNHRACRQRVLALSEARVGLAQGEPSTEAVGEPIIEDARDHLFSDATNDHALG